MSERHNTAMALIAVAANAMKRQDVATRQRIAQFHGARAPAKVKEIAHAISVTRYDAVAVHGASAWR